MTFEQAEGCRVVHAVYTPGGGAYSSDAGPPKPYVRGTGVFNQG